MIRVFRSGHHAHRTPLSYPALAPLFADTITQVDRPEAADLHVFAHVRDIAEADADLVRDWRRRRRPVVLLSEEPFWDTIWGRRPLERHIHVDTAWGVLPVVQVTHQTSALFTFDRIPYYLLTHHRFANTYRHRFARNAARTASAWRADFAARACHASFLFERRPEPYHAMLWPEGDLIGLCSWRTEMAQACHGAVERLGRSWHTGPAAPPSRFDLDNWYLDKMLRLDGRARTLGAVENTHQPHYLTEKFFDAFACGALPLYFANPGHGVHRLELPEDAWVNLAGLDPAAAAARVMGLAVDSTRIEAFHAAQSRLAALFCDTGAWVDERARLARALPAELARVLAGE